MKKGKPVFKFKPFSKKQRMVLNWWTPESPVKDADGIIADGAIRAGKTLAMSLSFVLWAMTNFDSESFAMCGKTVGSFRRNVLFWLKIMLYGRGYHCEERRSDNLVIISRGDTENYFYIFGGKDERSQDLIQGITLAGVFLDEVALMPESFVNQATGRCSVDGSTMWFNCNPEYPSHWFKVNWIDKAKDKGLLYLHFTMDDNLSLSERVKERYKRMYTGVWYERSSSASGCLPRGLSTPCIRRQSAIRRRAKPKSIASQLTMERRTPSPRSSGANTVMSGGQFVSITIPGETQVSRKQTKSMPRIWIVHSRTFFLDKALKQSSTRLLRRL